MTKQELLDVCRGVYYIEGGSAFDHAMLRLIKNVIDKLPDDLEEKDDHES